MEFLLSASFGTVTVEGAQFADQSTLWNVPRPRRDMPQFTDPWNTAPESDTKDKVTYRGFN